MSMGYDDGPVLSEKEAYTPALCHPLAKDPRISLLC